MIVEIYHETIELTEKQGITSNPERIHHLICHSHKIPEPIDAYHPLEKIELVIIDKWFEFDNPHLFKEL